jgi:hypothetical protein
MYPSDFPSLYASESPVGADYRIKIVRIVGPETDLGIIVDLKSLEMEVDATGWLIVTGKIVKAALGDLRVGLDLTLLGFGNHGEELARYDHEVSVRAEGDVKEFEGWLNGHGQRITELRILFEEKGDLLECSNCGRWEVRLNSIRWCQRCSWDRYMRRIKGL